MLMHGEVPVVEVPQNAANPGLVEMAKQRAVQTGVDALISWGKFLLVGLTLAACGVSATWVFSVRPKGDPDPAQSAQKSDVTKLGGSASDAAPAQVRTASVMKLEMDLQSAEERARFAEFRNAIYLQAGKDLGKYTMWMLQRNGTYDSVPAFHAGQIPGVDTPEKMESFLMVNDWANARRPKVWVSKNMVWSLLRIEDGMAQLAFYLFITDEATSAKLPLPPRLGSQQWAHAWKAVKTQLGLVYLMAPEALTSRKCEWGEYPFQLRAKCAEVAKAPMETLARYRLSAETIDRYMRDDPVEPSEQLAGKFWVWPNE